MQLYPRLLVEKISSMDNQLFNFLERYMPLEEEEKNAIEALGLFRNYKKGTLLLREGAISKENYFVISGCVRSYYNLEGEEKTTAIFTEFEAVTTPASGSDKIATYNLECIEDAIIVVSTPDMEKKAFEKFPRFEKLCRILSDQLLAKNQASFDSFKTSTPEQRYLDILETRPDLLQRVPQYQLASYLGIKPESLSRIRKRLIAQEKNKYTAFS